VSADVFLGTPVRGWTPPPVPAGEPLTGRYARLVKLSADAHAPELFAASKGYDHVWDYLPYGPFATLSAYRAWIEDTVAVPGHLFYAIQNLETAAWEGVASFLRIDPKNGSIEVGHINYSPALQKTRAGTEAMFLMMKWAFEHGYRRYEWKCNALNLASRRAAQRLGFSHEGVFRQAGVIKGRNRDTAWFAAIDSEWPALRDAFTAWLSPDNFAKGLQKRKLGELTGPIRVANDPALS
jgi:RimJ/RimL family protein N-acetyltransferase